jgi:hypothetical protein
MQCPTLAIVAEGSKELMLGNEAFACGVVERISGCAPAEVACVKAFASSLSSSRPMSRVTIAKSKLAETPHISTPVRLSTGPTALHVLGRKRSPQPTVE